MGWVNEGFRYLITGAWIWGGSEGIISRDLREVFGVAAAKRLAIFWADTLLFSIAALAAFITLRYMQGKIGYALTALREDEEVAKVMGVNTTKYKIIAFITLAAFAGLIGGGKIGVEKKLMEITRALVMKPKLLLLDEAMAGMPPKEIDKLVQFLKRIKEEEGIAIVSMVEHIMRAVAGFAERVVILHQSKKFLEAPTAEALSDPRVEIYLGRPQEVGDAPG